MQYNNRYTTWKWRKRWTYLRRDWNDNAAVNIEIYPQAITIKKTQMNSAASS